MHIFSPVSLARCVFLFPKNDFFGIALFLQKKTDFLSPHHFGVGLFSSSRNKSGEGGRCRRNWRGQVLKGGGVEEEEEEEELFGSDLMACCKDNFRSQGSPESPQEKVDHPSIKKKEHVTGHEREKEGRMQEEEGEEEVASLLLVLLPSKIMERD